MEITLTCIQWVFFQVLKDLHPSTYNNRQQIFPTDSHLHETGRLLTGSKESERLENLRRKKELVRTNRAQRVTSSRRKSSRLARTLMCTGDSDWETNGEEVDITRFLPPLFTASKKMKDLIRVGTN